MTCPRFEHDFSIEGLMGFDLKGRTIGVIGAGQIGLHVIRIAKGLGMNVLAYDARQNKILSEVMGFEYTSLEDLLARSDIITLHVPYNKYTHHLMNRDKFKLVKKGAILINTARGSIVDTEALIEALDKKILSGAGLDVIEGEELIKEEKQLLYDPKNIEVLADLVKDHILLSKDNVVFTPHIAFYSKEAMERILETTVENVTAFVSSNPQNVI
jgi:D-lactate dehydrogenase